MQHCVNSLNIEIWFFIDFWYLVF